MRRRHRSLALCVRVLCARGLCASLSLPLVLGLALWPGGALAEDSPAPSAPPQAAPPQSTPPVTESNAPSAPARGSVDTSQPLVSTRGFTRIGVLPLTDKGAVRDGAVQLTAMLKDRLGARFEGVVFIAIDLPAARLEGEPALIENAAKLGQQFDVQALLDGVFGGVDISGGCWPNHGSDMPEARGVLRWRLIECASGQLAAEGDIAPRKPQVYSQRIRTEAALVRSVMQGLVEEVGDALEGAGLLAGEPVLALASPAVKSKDTGGRR